MKRSHSRRNPLFSVNIPTGYAVDALQKLNINIDNESGSFITTAKVDDDKLVITTGKLYNKSFDKKELWPNYITFLEPAHKIQPGKNSFEEKIINKQTVSDEWQAEVSLYLLFLFYEIDNLSG